MCVCCEHGDRSSCYETRTHKFLLTAICSDKNLQLHDLSSNLLSLRRNRSSLNSLFPSEGVFFLLLSDNLGLTICHFYGWKSWESVVNEIKNRKKINYDRSISSILIVSRRSQWAMNIYRSITYEQNKKISKHLRCQQEQVAAAASSMNPLKCADRRTLYSASSAAVTNVRQ